MRRWTASVVARCCSSLQYHHQHHPCRRCTTRSDAGGAIQAPAPENDPLIAGIATKLLCRIPPGATVQVQTLYGSLSTEERRTMRRCGYPSLLNFLKHMDACGTSDGARVCTSSDGLRVTKVPPGTEASDPSVQQLLNPIAVQPAPSAVSGPRLTKPGSLTQGTHASLVDSAMSENLWEVYEPPLSDDFQPPPVPEGMEMLSKSDRKVHQKVGVGHASVFTADMLVPYLPTFFVPMDALLTVLPEGYTAEHIEGIFTGTRTVEVVRLEGQSFVRMHGGSTVDLSMSPAANARFPQFKPDPTLCDAFAPLFERPYKWYPLRGIVMGVAPAVASRLPYQRYQSLLFFAQMQHRFQFAADGEGEVCTVVNANHLEAHNTPTPIALSAVLRVLEKHEAVSEDEIVESLSRDALVGMVQYYPSMDAFLELHTPLFERCSVRRVVELKANAEARRRKGRSLEEKLEDALLSGEKRDVRKIRRRIAVTRNPNNPLIDRELLMQEVKKFLPKKRSIGFRSLMRNLPPDVVDLFPADQISLFRNNPQLFQVFEYKTVGRLHIMLAGLPLPPGHLRTSYTEPELVHMCAMHLLYHPRLMVDVFSRLPWGGREVVRTKYKGLFHLLAKYPQYFAIVFKDGKQKFDSRSATVSLLGQPPQVEVDEAVFGAPAASGGDDAQEDADAVVEVHRNAVQLGYVVPSRSRERLDDDAGEGGLGDFEEGR